jgi:hypothetical protein
MQVELVALNAWSSRLSLVRMAFFSCGRGAKARRQRMQFVYVDAILKIPLS